MKSPLDLFPKEVFELGMEAAVYHLKVHDFKHDPIYLHLSIEALKNKCYVPTLERFILGKLVFSGREHVFINTKCLQCLAPFLLDALLVVFAHGSQTILLRSLVPVSLTSFLRSSNSFIFSTILLLTWIIHVRLNR